MVHSPNLAAPSDCIQQLKRLLSTLYRRKEHGGLALIQEDEKLPVLTYRLQTLIQNARTITALWLEKWNILQPRKNPPNRERISATLDYLRILETDSAYMVPQGKTETVRTYRRRMYDTRVILMNTETKPPT